MPAWNISLFHSVIIWLKAFLIVSTAWSSIHLAILIIEIYLRAGAVIVRFTAADVEILALIIYGCLEVGSAGGRYYIALTELLIIIALIRSLIASIAAVIKSLDTGPLQYILVLSIKFH